MADINPLEFDTPEQYAAAVQPSGKPLGQALAEFAIAKNDEAKKHNFTVAPGKAAYMASAVEPTPVTAPIAPSAPVTPDVPSPVSFKPQAPQAAPMKSGMDLNLGLLKQASGSTPNFANTLYDSNSDDAALNSAHDKADRLKLISQLGQASMTIGNALGRSNVQAPVFDSIGKDADSGVKDVMQRRGAKLNEIKGQQLAAELQDKMALRDIKNPNTRLFMDMLKKAMPGVNTEGLSPEVLKDGGLNIGSIFQHLEAAKQRAHENSLKANTKTAEQQAKHFQETLQFSETNKGNNPDVRQAYIDRYNSDKLLKAVGGPGADLNKVPLNMLPVVVQEIGKIAKGGVPDVSEFKKTMPDSVRQKLTSLYDKATNSNSPANAKAYLETYVNYINSLRSEANQMINNKIGRIGNLKRNDMGEDNYHRYQAAYPEAFTDDTHGGAFPSDKEVNAGKVKVKNKEGQEGWIPKTQLNDAKKQGYVEIK